MIEPAATWLRVTCGFAAKLVKSGLGGAGPP